MSKTKFYLFVLFFLFFISLVQADTECYQETANVSTACGGLATGKYWTTTHDDGTIYTGTLYINYTNPGATSDSKWMVKATSASTNKTFSTNNCFSQTPIRLKVNVSSGSASSYAYFYCWDGSAWINMYNTGTLSTPSAGRSAGSYNLWYDGDWSTNALYHNSNWYTSSSDIFYEEGMWWNFGAPIINITNPPVNDTWYKTQPTVTHTSSGATNCWWTINKGLTNTTLTNCGDAISQTWSQGQTNITIYANNSAGLNGSATRRFNIDTVAPTITITAPSSNGQWFNFNTKVNKTVSDTNLQACWYSKNSGQSNTSLTTCGENITGQTWSAGLNTLIVYANDTAGNIGSAIRTFYIDTVFPTINIISPTLANNSFINHNLTQLIVNVSGTEVNFNEDVKFEYVLDGTYQDNLSMTDCYGGGASAYYCNFISDKTDGTDDGVYDYRIWINDSANNFAITPWRRVTFDNGNPSINISFPINNTTYNYQVNINFTANDTNLNTCWYSNTSGKVNYTFSCTQNLTGKTWSQGLNNITIWANDSAGNKVSSSVNFTIDTSFPQVSIAYPENITYRDNYLKTINLNLTVTGTNLQARWYSLNGATNQTFTGNTTLTGLLNNSNTLMVYANNTVGNINSTKLVFSLSYSPVLNELNISNISNYYNRNSLTDGLVGFWKFDEFSGSIAYDNVSFNNGTISSTGNLVGDFENNLDGFALDCGGAATYESIVPGKVGNNAVKFWAQGGDGLGCFYKSLNKQIYEGYTIYFYAKGYVGAGLWNGSQFTSYLERVDTGCRGAVNDANIMDNCNNNNQFSEWTLFKLVSDTSYNGLASVYFYEYGTTGPTQATYVDYVTENPIFYDKGVAGNSISFTGQNDSVTLTNSSMFNIISNLTLSLWVRNNNLSFVDEGGVNEQFLIAKYGGNWKGYALSISNGNLIFHVNNGTANARITTTSSSKIKQNEWTHVAATWNGTCAIVYINGNSNGTTCNTTFGSIMNDGDINLTLAKHSWDNYDNLIGQLDEVRIYNKTLSATEIKQLYLEVNPTFQENANVTIRVTAYDQDTPAVSLIYRWLLNGVEKLIGAAQTAYNFIVPSRNAKVELIVNDTNGYESRAQFNITLELFYPQLTLVVPANGANYSTATLNINYTVSDTTLQSCKYNVNNGINTTIGSSCANTTYTFTEGLHNVTVFANDTYGNENKSTNRFRIDLTAPSLTITTPTDYQSIIYNNITVNYTLSDSGVGVNSVWWTNTSGASNNSVTPGTNFTVYQGTPGTYTVTIYANDSVGNLVTKSIHYTYISTGAPAVTINAPTNNQWFTSGKNIDFNFTVISTNALANCSLMTNSSVWALNETNKSAITSGSMFSFTKKNMSENRFYLYNVYCWDNLATFGAASSNFTIGIDSISPVISGVQLGTETGSQTINFNFTVTETNQDSCWYAIYDSIGAVNNGHNNLSITCGGNDFTRSTNAFESFNLVLYARDDAGNLATSTKSFTLHDTGYVPPEGPGGGGGGAPTIVINQTINQTFCGDLICQDGKQGRVNRGETFENCAKDCGGNIDTLFMNCFSKDPEKRKSCIFFSSNWVIFLVLFIIAILILTSLIQRRKKKIKLSFIRGDAEEKKKKKK